MPCPDDAICQNCPAAADDDVCLPWERALRLIARMSDWRSDDPADLNEADRAGKARLIAQWGLAGDEEKLAAAEKALGVVR
jgi:hypothetical protein